MTYMFILKCALKLVLKNILYYDARSEKHKKKGFVVFMLSDDRSRGSSKNVVYIKRYFTQCTLCDITFIQ